MDESSPKSTLGVLGLVLLLLGGFVLLGRLPDFYQRITSHAPEVAPDFALDVVANGDLLGSDSRVARLSDFKGKAVLLDFWATWCEPCRVEAPIVDRVSRRMRDKGLVVLGVNEDQPDQGDPAAFAKHEGLTYPIVRDADGDTLRKYGGAYLPTLVVVSSKGTITAVRTGPTSDSELERLVNQAL
jgi:cytochrome c biogenesis protein CcmG, thiol:disulfide interchange protein DsbE